MSEALRERLEKVRHQLLALHKALVESERVTYEATVGPISSPNHFLQLLTTDPWFAWLQPLSLLIVSIDEAMDAKEPLTAEQVNTFIKTTSALLVPSEAGHDFARHYFEAMQRDPDVVMAHADVKKLFA